MRSCIRFSMKPLLRSWHVSAVSALATTTTWTGLGRSSTSTPPSYGCSAFLPCPSSASSLFSASGGGVPPQFTSLESIQSVQTPGMGSHTSTWTRAAIWPVAHMASISSRLRSRWVAAVSCSLIQNFGPAALIGGGRVSHRIVDPLPAPTMLSVMRTRHRSMVADPVLLAPNQSYQKLPLALLGRFGLPMARQLSRRRVWSAASASGYSSLKKSWYSGPDPASSTKRADTTPESSRPSK
mmetsp:Transcript_26434/g.61848  ORF Transcript_26434/g.61848 Transcript_26434/m.61848 type:complete len:239 (+) Transcript_26434:1306-2022(+)